MPVLLEHITQPTEQDWIDLGKIYADAPQEWLENSDDIKSSLQKLLDQDIWFIAGRFNARLLAALKAKKEGSTIYLSDLSVRKVTVKRGVAHQMMHHMRIWADEQGYTLVAKDVPPELANALINREFVEKEGVFKRNPR